MRITQLEVDGFGVWSGLTTTELSEQVNVFYGPNEAGKTTLMHFLRSMLYGFSPERRARYLPPLHPGRPGGAIHGLHGAHSFTIRRYLDGPDDGEEVIVVDRQGHASETFLADLLGDVDEAVYTNVFALGLREIQELGALSDTRAANLLYDLTLGLDRVSLVDVLRELETSRNRLLAADDRPSLVVQLLGQRERLQGEIEELREQTPRYLELMQRSTQIRQEIARYEAEDQQSAERASALALARAGQEKWQRCRQIEAQLAALDPGDTLPDDALGRLERLNQRLRERHERRTKIKRQRKQIRAEAQAIVVNEMLCRQAPRLEALNEQQQWISSLGQQVQQLETEIGQLETQCQTQQQQSGLSPGRGAKALHAALDGLRAQAKTLSGLRRRLRESNAAIAESRQESAKAAREVESALGKRSEQGLVKALERAGDLVSKLRRRVQLDERLDQMTRRQSDLEEQSHELLGQQMMPTWQVAALGSVFVVGFALMIGGLTTILNWGFAVLGILGMAASGLTKLYVERFAATRLDECHRQISLLNEQVERAKEERDELDAQLPRGGGPLVSRLQTAEKELAVLEELLPLDAGRESAERDARAARQQQSAARDEFKKALQRWKQSLRSAGLPDNLVPKQLRETVRQSRQLQQLASRLEQRRAELAERKREYGLLTARITQLASEVGHASPSSDPLGQLKALLAELREHEQRLKRRAGLEQQLAQLRRKQLRLERRLERIRQQRRALLSEAQAPDEAEFRRRALAQAETERLRLEHQTLNREMLAAFGDRAETILALLESTDNLQHLEQESDSARRAIKSSLQALFQEQGEVLQQTKALADDRRLAERRVELAMVEKRLREALDRWRVLAVCGVVLESVRQLYERERQPEALREASGYLQRLTEGRYTRVWTPLGEHVLRVDDAEGRALPVEVLSRGTREQLFLSLRLALVSSYARRGVRLPLVLDDVFVNFDAGRTKAAAAVLRDFARSGYQLLVFTCHEHIARLFKSLKAEVRQLPDHHQPNASLRPTPAEAEEPVKKPKRPRHEPIETFEIDESHLIAEPPPEPVEPPPPPIVEEPPAADAPVALLPEPPEPPAAPEPAVEPPAEPVAKETRPAKTGRRRRTAPAEPPAPRQVVQPSRGRWDAEEFAGELEDRVRLTESDGRASGRRAESPASSSDSRQAGADEDEIEDRAGGDDAEAA